MINEISQRKRKASHSGIKSLKDRDGNIIESPSKIANCLNDHFSSVGGRMAQELESNSTNTKDPISYIKKNVDKSLFMNFTNSTEISKGIHKLQDKKSSGYDLISNCILKSTNSSISPYLEILFNSCIYHGIFPDIFKIAQVIPLHKGGDKENCNNYRPISLLPAIGKLFEKLISYRLIHHLDSHNILSHHQYGFRKNYSTELAVNDIHEKLLNNLDKGLNS